MKNMVTSVSILALFTIVTASFDAEAQTKSTERVPPFDLEYFVGSWSFDWTIPETPLGPSGDIVGIEAFQLIAPAALAAPANGFPAFPSELMPPATVARVLESRIEGRGPNGAYRARTLLTYDPDTKQATQHEIDQMGNVTTRKGTINGDLGGIYTFTWESMVQRGDQTIHLKGRRTGFSPNNFRDFLQYSLDGKKFITFGQPWFRKPVGGQKVRSVR